MTDILHIFLLGLLEGLTEFIPVSSTGHLVLAGHFLGFQGPPGKVFEIAIQLGAILAVCLIYWQRLWGVTRGLTHDPAARRFALNIALGFLPAAVIGLVAYKYIKAALENPAGVAIALIVGGVAILLVERVRHRAHYTDAAAFPPLLALKIGFMQCLAMIPGVSRSGATIMGALMMGVERKAAAEFSFFLAIPTMLAATAYDLYKHRDVLVVDDLGAIAIGFVTAFVAALLVVRTLVNFVGRHGFGVFGWYRIVLGSVALLALWA